MKIFAPKYYLNFKCTASNCTHSCCIGWEIDVDGEALQKYSSLKADYGTLIRQSISDLPTPHFKLQPNGRCPHLDGDGLCKIISNLGEEYLCNICKEHPRFYNQTSDCLEVGLGACCEEACRIILTSDDYRTLVEIEDCEDCACDCDFDPTPTRKEILDILSEKSKSFKEKLEFLQNKFSVSTKTLTDNDWRDLLNSLEYMDSAHKKTFTDYSSDYDFSPDCIYLERALAYFVYRYVTKAQSSDEIRQYLGLCLFLLSLLNYLLSVENATTLDKTIDCLIALSEEIEYNEDNLEAILFEFI